MTTGGGGDLLPKNIVKKLDDYIEKRLDQGMEVVSIRCKDHRILEMYPGDWPRKRVAASLKRYATRRWGKWDIIYLKKSHQYHYTVKQDRKSNAGQDLVEAC